jgi:hypothetical protein
VNVYTSALQGLGTVTAGGSLSMYLPIPERGHLRYPLDEKKPVHLMHGLFL